MEEDIEPTYVRGQVVRYSKPEPGEEHLTFIVLEDNGNRVLIQSMQYPAGWRFIPTQMVSKGEVTRNGRES